MPHMDWRRGRADDIQYAWLSDFRYSGKLKLKELPYPYLYTGKSAKDVKSIRLDLNFLGNYQLAIIMGELQYGDFMRQQLRRLPGDIPDEARLRDTKGLNPFSGTSLVFLKAFSLSSSFPAAAEGSLKGRCNIVFAKGKYTLRVLRTGLRSKPFRRSMSVKMACSMRALPMRGFGAARLIGLNAWTFRSCTRGLLFWPSPRTRRAVY